MLPMQTVSGTPVDVCMVFVNNYVCTYLETMCNKTFDNTTRLWKLEGMS